MELKKRKRIDVASYKDSRLIKLGVIKLHPL